MQEILKQDEMLLTREIEARFGRVTQLMDEDDGVAICVIAGSRGITLVTQGMSQHAMNAPPGECARAELVMHLPADWNINSRDERDLWPLHWLRLLANLPAEENTWLGWGHTVPSDEPFASNTGFESLLLLDAFIPREQQLDGDACEITLPGNESVRLYQLYPLYPQELRCKLAHGAQALVERLKLAKLLRPQLDIARTNLFNREVLVNWDGPDGCLATNRILADHAPVGYCYREQPYDDEDSGWRFTAGDESDEYMNDPCNSDVYTLNDLANYDVDILDILNSATPCAFARGENGFEQLKVIL